VQGWERKRRVTMANREACELYIEQEIKDALKEGKKPYSIGKELSKWVEKLFETTIPARTIQGRAERLVAKKQPRKAGGRFSAFVEKKSDKSRAAGTGGKRKGAGRKTEAQLEKERLQREYDRIDKETDRETEEMKKLLAEIATGPKLSTAEFKMAVALIDAGYKALSRTHHPDVGGSTESMTTLNEVKDKLLRAVGKVK
jgi:hypothetical protein